MWDRVYSEDGVTGTGLPGFYQHKGSRSPWGDVFWIHKSGLEMVGQTKGELLSPAQCLLLSKPPARSWALPELSGKAGDLMTRSPTGWSSTSQRLPCQQLLQGEEMICLCRHCPLPTPGAPQSPGSPGAGGKTAASLVPEEGLGRHRRAAKSTGWGSSEMSGEGQRPGGQGS